MQVYAIVHDGGNCLMFKKRQLGYFFNRTVVVKTELNGAGAYCFPGGKLGESENPAIGAIREFGEETGVYIRISDSFAITKGGYTGVFFKVSSEELDAIRRECERNLVIAENTVKEIKEGDYGVGEKLSVARLPSDNELEAEVCKVSFSIAKTEFDKDEKKAGWFSDLVESYLNSLLKV